MSISSVYSSVWATQGLTKPVTKSATASLMGTEDSAANRFKEFMKATPEEQIRDAWLAKHGITKAEFDAMSPDQKAKIIAAIKNEIEQRAKEQALDTPGVNMDILA